MVAVIGIAGLLDGAPHLLAPHMAVVLRQPVAAVGMFTVLSLLIARIMAFAITAIADARRALLADLGLAVRARLALAV